MFSSILWLISLKGFWERLENYVLNFYGLGKVIERRSLWLIGKNYLSKGDWVMGN
jgi:hypothetical protein